jgi:hypothetical protein
MRTFHKQTAPSHILIWKHFRSNSDMFRGISYSMTFTVGLAYSFNFVERKF